jgi:dolichyl-phosphate beta-glucosyltransferase
MSPNSAQSGIVLSIVLPSYKSAEIIADRVPGLMRHLERLGAPFEVVVVDDGSGDGGRTEAIARELGARCVIHPENRGKGAAVRTGMLAAKGAFRIFTDADVPYGHDTIDKMLWYLDVKEFHMVVGDRTLERSSYYAKVSALRNVASHVFSGFVGRFAAGGWYDTQCGIKGFRGAVADDLFGVTRIERFAFDFELFYVALKRNYDIKRIPVVLECNDTSSVNVLRDGLEMVKDVGTVRINQLMGRYKPRGDVSRLIDSAPEDGWRPRG